MDIPVVLIDRHIDLVSLPQGVLVLADRPHGLAVHGSLALARGRHGDVVVGDWHPRAGRQSHIRVALDCKGRHGEG